MILVRLNVQRVADTAEDAAKLVALGYTELPGQEIPVPGNPSEEELNTLTLKALREKAKVLGIDSTLLKKAELLDILKYIKEG